MQSLRIFLFFTVLLLSTFYPSFVFSQRWEKVTNIQAQYNLPSDYYLDVFFLPSNPQYGWACGYNGKTIRTTDGGISWLGSTAPNTVMLESIQFLTPQIGYTSGPGGIYKSIDGGASWTNISSGIASDMWGLYFLSVDYGIVIGGGCDTSQQFNITTDGGATWSTSAYNIPNTGLTDAILLTDGIGFASSSGRIWKSLDSGRTWNIASSTGDVGWQEEMTFFNGTMAVPTAGDNCTGGPNGSLRFSSDSGITWRSFPVPVNMFGTYVLDENRAWGCGISGAIYYTSNAGISWDLRNCGIGNVDLDDVFFIDENNGWVVGNGVFRLVPASRSISKNTIDFGTICIPGSKLELVGALNSSFTNVTVSAELLTNDDNAFSIANYDQQPFAVGNCEQRSLGLLFSPTTEGLKNCTVQITFSTGEVFTVTASGIGTSRKSRPADTIVLFDTTQCNTLQYANTLWYNTGNVEENISEVTLDSGSNKILYLSPPTLRVPPNDSINVIYSVIPLDTGWVSARFRFKVEPCNNFTYQDLLVYGKSAILNATDTTRFKSTCDQISYDSLKIKNTGNDTLFLHNPRLVGVQSTSFEIVSYSDGSDAFQLKKIAPNDSMYLLLKFAQTVQGNITAQIEFLTNDSTKVRGNKAIYKGQLLGFWGAPDLTSDKKTINFDSICVGETKTDTVIIYNRGVVSSEFEPNDYDKTSFLVQPLLGSFPIVIPPNDSSTIIITAKPQRPGITSDTIWLVSSSCKVEKFIVVDFFGKLGLITINPNAVSHQVLQLTYDTAFVIVKNEGNVSVDFASIEFFPPNAKLEILSPKGIKTLAPNDTFSIMYHYTAGLRETIQSSIRCLPAVDQCTQIVSIPVAIRGVGSFLQTSDTVLFIETQCVAGTVCTPLLLINKGISADTIKQVDIFSSSAMPITLSNQFDVGTIILADETITASVCYTAFQEGSQIDTIVITTQNSDKPFPVIVYSSYYTAATSIVDSAFDFGTVYKCDTIKVLSTKIHNNGTLIDTLDFYPLTSIESPHLVAPVSLIVNGKDSIEYSIALDPSSFQTLPEGMYTARYVYRSRVCGTEIVVNVSCEYVNPTLNISTNSIDFGEVWMDEEKGGTITLTNTSSNTITILSNDFEDTQLGFFCNPLDFPITIQPNSSYDLNVFFRATIEGTSITILTLNLQSVCADSLSINVTGFVPFESYDASFGLDDKSGMPGEEVVFPLYLYDSLSRADISAIEFTIYLDGRLLSPKGILLPWTIPPRFIPYEFENDILSFSVPQNETFELGRQPMQVARIVTRALLNKPDKTPLNFRSIVPITTKRVSTTSKNGSFFINVCGIRSGLDLLPTALVAFPHPVVTSPTIDISIETSAEQFVDIEIFTMLGTQLITTRTTLVASTQNQITLPINVESNGAYFIVVKTQYGEVFQQQIILQK